MRRTSPTRPLPRSRRRGASNAPVDIFRAVERVDRGSSGPTSSYPRWATRRSGSRRTSSAFASGIPVLFLLYTIFPDPLRITVDRSTSRSSRPRSFARCTDDERAELNAFRTGFTTRAKPIREFRRWPIEARRVPIFAGHVRRKLSEDRDNDYLRPWRLLASNVAETLRARSARPFYDRLDPSRPFVYFPLHVTDDYKIKKVIPHCVDQASLVEQVADALPQGYDLVLKEHPMSVGRNPLRLLRRLRSRENVQLVAPRTNTHELIRRSEAVAVIGSTVGLEALLYAKPVLTLGQPFYAGYGVTLDVDSFREIRAAVPECCDSGRTRRGSTAFCTRR